MDQNGESGVEHPPPLVWILVVLGSTVRVRVATTVRLCPSFGGIATDAEEFEKEGLVTKWPPSGGVEVPVKVG